MSQNKKIIFDGRFLSLSHAGLGRYSCELLRALLPLDLEQKYILLIRPGTKFDKDLAERLYERKTPVEIIEADIVHYSLAEQTKFLKLLNGLKPDLVHFPHFNHPLYYKGKFVVTIHDLTLSQYAERGSFLKRKIYGRVICHVADKSQKILTVSNFVKAEIAREFKIDPKKIITTYNGIDEKFTKITSPQALKRVGKYGLDKPYILSVGQRRSHKNLERLIEAFAKIVALRKYAGKIDLVFVGRKDSKSPVLTDKIDKLELGNSVKFTGFVEDEDLPVVYNNAVVFAMPSFSEGFGLPGLEAQACGTPVVSSNRTCLPEIYGNGALYFNPENVTDMAEKITRILEDKKLALELIAKATENAKRFTWKQTAQKTLEVYREILYK